MKRLLILTFLFLLCADCLAQQDPVQVVRTYITTLNDALSSPNDMTRRRKIEDLLGAGSPGIKDEIVEKYNTKSTSRMLSGQYLAIFYDLIQTSSTHWIKVSIIGTPTVKDDRGFKVVYAVLQYTGAISLKTASCFWISGGKITGIMSDEIGIAAISSSGGKPDPEGQQIVEPDRSAPHSSIDLGLPSRTLWATTNIGANNPWEYGDYFAWGETTTKTTYSWNNYKYCKDGDYHKLTKYCNKSDYGNNGFTDSRTTLEKSDDVAYQTWGRDWCMPTSEQRDELIKNCYWVWTENYKGHDVKGYIVYKALKESDKGKKIYKGSSPDASYSPDRSVHIFLPAAGWKGSDGKLSYAGSYGGYWSSSLNTDDPYGGRNLDFGSGYVYADGGSRYYGSSVRAVRCKN